MLGASRTGHLRGSYSSTPVPCPRDNSPLHPLRSSRRRQCHQDRGARTGHRSHEELGLFGTTTRIGGRGGNVAGPPPGIWLVLQKQGVPSAKQPQPATHPPVSGSPDRGSRSPSLLPGKRTSADPAGDQSVHNLLRRARRSRVVLTAEHHVVGVHVGCLPRSRIWKELRLHPRPMDGRTRPRFPRIRRCHPPTPRLRSLLGLVPRNLPPSIRPMRCPRLRSLDWWIRPMRRPRLRSLDWLPPHHRLPCHRRTADNRAPMPSPRTRACSQ